MKKKGKILVGIIVIVFFMIVIGLVVKNHNQEELRSIRSEKELERKYEENWSDDFIELLRNIAELPFSLDKVIFCPQDTVAEMGKNSFLEIDSAQATTNSSSSKDYSTTNIQVENVDEADIIKTDGNYIYSISEKNVVVTNTIDPKNIKIESKIAITGIPEDLILYQDKLVVISTKSKNEISYYQNRYYSENNTVVQVYDIAQKDSPKLRKKYELYEPYYTSRCIANRLYVVANGGLRKENDEVIAYYQEDNEKKKIGLENIKYLKDIETDRQTLISMVDLENVTADIKVESYLIDISNAYVSEKSFYLLNQKYEYNEAPISAMFGWKGILGIKDYYEQTRNDNGNYTTIYKFDILENGEINYLAKVKTKGETINQYSLDEKNGHLRIALDSDDGARIEIFDEKMKQIGASSSVAKGEKMYTSRFIDDKAYLVTYQTIDPLFVIDLSNEARPKVLGELEIPGYSTYLHPYDENHLIGIGMETKEVVHRNSSGKVISTTATTVGMKMALFDISDVTAPKQIASTVIGDRRTTSAILTNPKALLFSKEKQLIAIPVNNYQEDFFTSDSNNSYESAVRSYTSYNKKRVAEGYLVYQIDIENGFRLKGGITHNVPKDSVYHYSKLLRGVYIDNNLYTVSETTIKVNDLEKLELINELKIEGE